MAKEDVFIDENLAPASRITDAEVATLMWFCVSACGVSTWAKFAQLIMHCERNPHALVLIKLWHDYQKGVSVSDAMRRSTQEKIIPLIHMYKYAKRF